MALTKSAASDIALGKDGSYSKSRDVLKHWAWDTRYFGTTVSDNTFFTQPIGSSWRSGNKTRNETNLTDAGKLPTGQDFLVKKMRIALCSYTGSSVTAGEDVVQSFVNLIQSSVFEIKIAGREFDLQIHGSAFVPTISVDTTATSAQRKGDLIASGAINFSEKPIMIANQVNFSVVQYMNNPDSNVVTVLNAACAILNAAYCTMQVALEGTLTRAK